MSKTIAATFDPSILPDWAKAYPVVVALARVNLAYRAQICESTQQGPTWQRLAIGEAYQWLNNNA